MLGRRRSSKKSQHTCKSSSKCFRTDFLNSRTTCISEINTSTSRHFRKIVRFRNNLIENIYDRKLGVVNTLRLLPLASVNAKFFCVESIKYSINNVVMKQFVAFQIMGVRIASLATLLLYLTIMTAKLSSAGKHVYTSYSADPAPISQSSITNLNF